MTLNEFPVGLATLDGGRIVKTNSAFDRLARVGQSGLVGRAFVDLFAPEDRSFIEHIEPVLADQEWHRVSGLGADGVPFVLLTRFGIDEDGCQVAYATQAPPSIHVGDEKTPDYERRGTWERAGVDRVLSHDVRGALRGASSFLKLLSRETEGALGEPSENYLETAAAAVDRADVMTCRLVDYLRLSIRPVRLDPIELEDLLPTVIEASLMQYPGDPPDLQVGPLPRVLANRPLIVEALAELITNARKFSPETPKITLSRVRSQEGWVYIEVSDEGPGFEPDLGEEAFDLFRLLQPKGKYPGVGMGLPVTRRILEIHGGGCWLLSDGRSGTRAVVRLPSAPPGPLAEQEEVLGESVD